MNFRSLSPRKPSLAFLAAALLAGCGGAPSTPSSATAAAQPPASASGIFNKPVRVDSLTNDILMKYDHDHSGRLDLVGGGGVSAPGQTRDERLRKETVRQLVAGKNGRGQKVVYTISTYTRRDLFYAADADRDDRVTRDELLAAIAAFDQDRDQLLSRRGLWGWLTFKTKGEYDKLATAYGEVRLDVQRVELPFEDAAGRRAIEAEGYVEQGTPDDDLKSAWENTGN